MNLYEIDSKLFNLIENAVDVETGELYETQEELDKAIDECDIELEKKIENIGCFIKNLEADTKALKEEEANLKHRREIAEKKIESLKKYLNGYLMACYPNDADRAKWKFNTPKVVLGFRRSSSVEVEDLSKLDKAFIKVKTETSADKTAIKDAIKAGKEVVGAYIRENLNLSIK